MDLTRRLPVVTPFGLTEMLVHAPFGGRGATSPTIAEAFAPAEVLTTLKQL